MSEITAGQFDAAVRIGRAGADMLAEAACGVRVYIIAVRKSELETEAGEA